MSREEEQALKNDMTEDLTPPKEAVKAKRDLSPGNVRLIRGQELMRWVGGADRLTRSTHDLLKPTESRCSLSLLAISAQCSSPPRTHSRRQARSISSAPRPA